MDHEKMNYALRKLQEQIIDQKIRTDELLAKESEKWNSGQQRRRALYMEDRERGASKYIRENTAISSAGAEVQGVPTFSSSNFCAGPPVANSFCEQTTSGNIVNDNGVFRYAKSANNESDDVVLCTYEAPGIGVISTKGTKKKRNPESLLMGTEAPSLDSLLMDI